MKGGFENYTDFQAGNAAVSAADKSRRDARDPRDAVVPSAPPFMSQAPSAAR